MNIPATPSLPAKASGDLLTSKSLDALGENGQPIEKNEFSELVGAPLNDPDHMDGDNLLTLDVSEQFEIDPLLEGIANQEHEALTVTQNPESIEVALGTLLETIPLPLQQNNNLKASFQKSIDLEEEQIDLASVQENIVLDEPETSLIHQSQWIPLRKDAIVPANADASQAEAPISFASQKNASNFVIPVNENGKQAATALITENRLSEIVKNQGGNGVIEQKISIAVDEFSQLGGVKKETHISFLQPSTPNQLPGIISKAASEVRNANTPDISMMGAVDLSSKPVAQMKIQLLPRNLGLVEVTMQRQDGAISIQISTETAEAERLIARENNSIKESLRSVGLFLSDIKVQTVVFSDREYNMKLDGAFSEQSNLQQNSQSSDHERHERAEDNKFAETGRNLNQSESPQESGERFKDDSFIDDLYL